MSLISLLLGHLERLGGILVRPRRTLERIADRGEGHVLEVALWAVVVTTALTPERTGQGLLLMRADLFDGLMVLLNMLANRLVGAIVGVLIGAFIIALVDRHRNAKPRLGFDRSIDVVAFLLVPHLALASLGGILRAFGVELWFMPHRLPQGPPFVVFVRVLVAWGWSVTLFFALLATRISAPREREAAA